MKSIRPLILLVVLASSAPAVADDPEIERLISMMSGRFDNGSSVVSSDEFLSDVRHRVEASAIGKYVVYLQLNRGASREVYRQRVLVFTRNEVDDVIEQRAYILKDPEPFASASPGDAVFAEINAHTVERSFPNGCAQRWYATEDGYSGYVDPQTCQIISSRTGNPRRIEAETLLTESTLSLAERGFDDDGTTQLFGSPVGEFTVLQRVD